MIVRVCQAIARPGREAGFERVFGDEAVPLMTRTPGGVSPTAGAPRPETPGRLCMVMVWESLAALKASAGED